MCESDFIFDTNDINRLINITKCLYLTYKNRTYYDQNLEDDIKLCIEQEDKIYKKLKLNKKNIIPFITRFNYILLSSNLTDELKYAISERFSNYCLYTIYKMPFLSTKKNFLNSFRENSKKITEQITIDFCRNVQCLLQRDIRNSKYKMELKLNFIALNEIQYFNKFLYKMNNNELVLDSREKCINFGQNPKNVDYLYFSYISDILLEYIDDALFYNDDSLRKVVSRTKLNINIANIKAGLFLLSKEECKIMLNQYQRRILRDDESLNAEDQSINVITTIENTIKKIALEKSVKIKRKTK